MVRFLVERPIAVLMTLLAMIVLGIYSYLILPVSLLPDLDIPVITVRVNYPDIDARNLENTVTKPLRNHLSQVSGLNNIESKTMDGLSEITLHFSYTVDTKYAAIETNEKIDEIISAFPVDMDRPIVIRSKPSDIPVFYLNIMSSKDYLHGGKSIIELSQYTESIIKKRLEQLSDVSMVDINGLVNSRIDIIPDNEKLRLHNITYQDISSAIRSNNLKIGNLSFRDGYYTYRLKVIPLINSLSDIKNIKIKKDNNYISLHEISEIKHVNTLEEGISLQNGTRVISLAVYKHIDARMEDISKNIQNVIVDIQKTNPDIIITKERDQTQLLAYSLLSLKQTLIIGLILAVVIVFLMMNRFILSLIISISVPISLIITFLGLNLAGISINIISLSGLIFSVGLMIDNSIIIIDNINQHQRINPDSISATVAGTNEVIRPLISSMLTTCAVFIPLITLSGVSGAIFYDQAITISISLLVSLLISIMVIPVLYQLLINKSKAPIKKEEKLILLYENTLRIVMKNKKSFLLIFLLLIPIGIILFGLVKKEQFPKISQNDFICKVIWNEPVSLYENETRIRSIMKNTMEKDMGYFSAHIGKSGYQMEKELQQSTTEASIYFRLKNKDDITTFSRKILEKIVADFPNSIVKLHPSKNVFQTIFKPTNELLIVKFRNNSYDFVDYSFVNYVQSLIINDSIDKNSSVSVVELFVLEIDTHKLLLYGISYDNILAKLRIMFGSYTIDKLNRGNSSNNIVLTQDKENIYSSLSKGFVKGNNDEYYPISEIISVRKASRLKNILSDKKGEFFDLTFNNSSEFDKIQSQINHIAHSSAGFNVDYEGNFIENKILFDEFIYVLIISLILLYLILAAQFESLLLPIIILLEIIFDITGALFFIYIFDSSLNIMSGLGIIVMCGIIINDSIIKIDTIRRTHRKNHSIMESIMEGGRRRFNPIIMTSLTTILALVPFLFFKGLGVELQQPLALSIIGGLLTGTFVSLYFIPIMYFYLNKLSSLFVST